MANVQIFDARRPQPQGKRWSESLLEMIEKWKRDKMLEEQQKMQQQQVRVQAAQVFAQADERGRAYLMAQPQFRQIMGLDAEYQADPRIALHDKFTKSQDEKMFGGGQPQGAPPPPSPAMPPQEGPPPTTGPVSSLSPDLGKQGSNALLELFKSRPETPQGGMPPQMPPQVQPQRPTSPLDNLTPGDQALFYHSYAGGAMPSYVHSDAVNADTYGGRTSPKYIESVDIANKIRPTFDEAADNARDEDHYTRTKEFERPERDSRIGENNASASASLASAGHQNALTKTEGMRQEGTLPTTTKTGTNSLGAALAKSAVDQAEKALNDAQAALTNFENRLSLPQKNDKFDPNAIADRRIALNRAVQQKRRDLESAMAKYEAAAGGGVGGGEFDYDMATGKLIPKRR